ncbi:hypothetical protein [Sphingomonas abaci]|uniref:Uncharacterized protein n=1 Tax=Sphingomonas abaci TaxID=237611 RepID=A0A7W7AKE6_9SPHN|nr:hypothetical protein [Sphingomonas abaci]MBB4618655.1 hypothetical protein [Sphingomonas abaci]
MTVNMVLRFLPRAEIGRISGQSMTVGRPGDGWYIAFEWLGWATILELMRSVRND